LHEEDRETARLAVEHAAATRSDYDIEYRVSHPRHGARWIAAKGRATYGVDGAVTGMTGVVQDITGRKVREEALRASEERFRAIFNQAAVGMAIASLDGYFSEFNARFVEILGYTAEELHGLTFAEITHPEDLEETWRRVRALLEGELAHYQHEKRYMRKDGAVVWSLTRVTVLRDRWSRPERFVGVIEDITERKNAEAALHEETRTLELLNKTGSALAANLDLQTLVQSITDAATDLSGAQFGSFFYNTTDENGDAFLLYTLSGAPREAFEAFGRPRATSLFGPTFRGEAPIRCDDVLADPRYGKWAPHYGMPKGHLPVRSYLAAPVVSRSGEVIGGLFFGHSRTGVFTERDERLITGVAAQAAIAIDNARLYEASQKAAEERQALLERERAARAEAERASTSKDEFLATLSHELRTPLSAILGWAQLLRITEPSETDLRTGLETIERNARIQTQLIEDLLDMSRITSGKLRLDVQPVVPLLFVEAAIDTVRPAAEAKGVRIEKVLDPAAGPISGDSSRLQQAVWNLLSNAIKFTPKGGKIQVVLERVDSHIEISVADTGIGINPEFLPHVFERFRQADASSTRSFGGLGLGLSIVKHLVELHGGTAQAKSEGEGRGSTFCICLPLAVVHRSPAAYGVHPTVSASVPTRFDTVDLAGIRVLVVDDERDARELIARVLVECKAEVFTAAGADEALQVARASPPHVLISDIGMPDVDGYELLKRFRAIDANAAGKIPAIALTAFARSQDRTRALRAGFLVHVAKPVEPAELIATVASVVGRSAQPPS
jgi:PAS domain S-box-containing protein